MLQVTFYNCSDEPQDVHKANKTTLGTYNCNVYDTQDIEAPAILLPRNDNLRNANYCRIPFFNRYYYCRLEQLPDGREIMRCDSDPLTSFWDSYKNSPCIAKRSTSSTFPNMVDEGVITTPKITRTEIEVVSNENSCFHPDDDTLKKVVLTVAGRCYLDNKNQHSND